jgi:UDP-N-acetylmuramoyl-tripeptide--D-alanyl-D-alanine ligase
VRLALFGEHHVANALAVAAVARELGMPVEAIAAALGRGRAASRWRMEVTDRPDGVRVVNDAYNANPDSMRAALKALVAMAGGRRTWAVLGEMLELGPDSLTAHDEIGRLAVRLNVSRLVAVGPGARPIHTGAVHEGSWGEESVHVPDVEAAYALLRDQLQPGDLVLLKSSRDSGLRHLGDRLAAEGRAGA